MREHPIPQDIVGYRFHIVGSMTLKQFAELAIGAILGLIIYSTNLPAPIKWPLIFVGGALGAAAAFLPIAERPLDHWITTFFKALYQPTKFFWTKSSKIPELFLFEPGKGVMEAKDEIDLTPARRQRIKEYLASVKSFTHDKDDLDEDEQKKINSIMETFDKLDPGKVVAIPQIKKPKLKVRTRSLDVRPPTKEKTVVYEKTLLKTDQVAKKVEVPKAKTTKIEAKILEESKEGEIISTQQQAAYATSSDVTTESDNNEEGVVFNAALPFPSKPTQPNKLVGMILTTKNELIPEAVVEIKDEQNRVVRAVKSNALGQFFISTALKNGGYSIVVNHPKYQFNPQEIYLENEIIEPIEVRSLN